MTFREIERILLDDGWQYTESRGSHYQYRHPDKSGKVTVPNHRGDLNTKTVNSILRQAGIKR